MKDCINLKAKCVDKDGEEGLVNLVLEPHENDLKRTFYGGDYYYAPAFLNWALLQMGYSEDHLIMPNTDVSRDDFRIRSATDYLCAMYRDLYLFKGEGRDNE